MKKVAVPPISKNAKEIESYVITPSGKKVKVVVTNNNDGTIGVQYEPDEEGVHMLHILHNKNPVEGSPFKIFVDLLANGGVTAYGPGLVQGVVDEIANFTIKLKGVSGGGLKVEMEGPAKSDVKTKNNGDGTHSVTYNPPEPGEYRINIKYGGEHIKGSPFSAKITGESKKKFKIVTGLPSEIKMRVLEPNLDGLVPTITLPSGKVETCTMRDLGNNSLGVTFLPLEVGEHVVNVKKEGKDIIGSPFKITVVNPPPPEPDKVLVTGEAIKTGLTNVENSFGIDIRNAGTGGVSVTIEGPIEADIEVVENKGGLIRVVYKTDTPGEYTVNITFAEKHVPGSPFLVFVENGPNPPENVKSDKSDKPNKSEGKKKVVKK